MFDNIAILATIKFLHTDAKPINKLAFLGWSVGLFFGLVKNFIELFKIIQTQKCDKKDCEILIFNKLLEITGKLGDLLVSLNGLEVPLILTGKSLNDGVLGLGGFTSAVIAIYSTWK